MDRKRLLSYISGSINEAILSCNEYLMAENRILKGQLKVVSCIRTQRGRLWGRLETVGEKGSVGDRDPGETGDHPVLASSMDRPEG